MLDNRTGRQRRCRTNNIHGCCPLRCLRLPFPLQSFFLFLFHLFSFLRSLPFSGGFHRLLSLSSIQDHLQLLPCTLLRALKISQRIEQRMQVRPTRTKKQTRLRWKYRKSAEIEISISGESGNSGDVSSRSGTRMNRRWCMAVAILLN